MSNIIFIQKAECGSRPQTGHNETNDIKRSVVKKHQDIITTNEMSGVEYTESLFGYADDDIFVTTDYIDYAAPDILNEITATEDDNDRPIEAMLQDINEEFQTVIVEETQLSEEEQNIKEYHRYINTV